MRALDLKEQEQRIWSGRAGPLTRHTGGGRHNIPEPFIWTQPQAARGRVARKQSIKTETHD
jgi:hypothetical protein